MKKLKQPTSMNKEIKNDCGVMDHDFKHLKRYGRADYRCPKCSKNVMLLLVFAAEAGLDLTK